MLLLPVLAHSAVSEAAVEMINTGGYKVEVYGRVDAGVDLVSNVDLARDSGGEEAGTGTQLRGGGNQWGTSLFGIKGSMQIRPGLKGVMLLETGFDAVNGKFNGDGFFNRRAFVGLESDNYGMLVAGKNLFISNDVYNIDPMIHEFMSTSTLSRGRVWPGADQMVEYRSPVYAGFQLGLQHAFGGDAESVANNSRSGASLLFADPESGVELRAIYDVVRDEIGGYSNVFSSSEELILGGTWTLERLKLFGGVEFMRASDADPENPRSVPSTDGTSLFPTEATHGWIGASYQASSSLVLRGAWFHISLNEGGGSANLITGGGEYYLAENVFLYANVGTVLNSSAAQFSVEATDERPPVGEKQYGAYVGAGFSF
ncbi:porin [Solimonas sp. K1W22B-7]|uniref:porin n=1 Tax=Solimonas sp. K1W22B-7 TaxID=2303331 RepID=UPI0013C46750|nr:porin [Solimonas sp. K1W22B-7]